MTFFKSDKQNNEEQHKKFFRKKIFEAAEKDIKDENNPTKNLNEFLDEYASAIVNSFDNEGNPQTKNSLETELIQTLRKKLTQRIQTPTEQDIKSNNFKYNDGIIISTKDSKIQSSNEKDENKIKENLKSVLKAALLEDIKAIYQNIKTELQRVKSTENKDTSKLNNSLNTGAGIFLKFSHWYQKRQLKKKTEDLFKKALKYKDASGTDILQNKESELLSKLPLNKIKDKINSSYKQK